MADPVAAWRLKRVNFASSILPPSNLCHFVDFADSAWCFSPNCGTRNGPLLPIGFCHLHLLTMVLSPICVRYLCLQTYPESRSWCWQMKPCFDTLKTSPWYLPLYSCEILSYQSEAIAQSLTWQQLPWWQPSVHLQWALFYQSVITMTTAFPWRCYVNF